MTSKRFETGIHVNVGSEGLVIQQKPGASAMPLQILSHDATPVFMVHTSGEVTAPMGINIGAATKTEIEHLSGVTSSVQQQIDLKSNSATPTFTGIVTVPTLSVNNNSTVGTVVSGTWQGSTISSNYLATGSTSASGVVQLSDSINSTSTSLAATANSVRQSSRDDMIQFYMEVI
jgi:hypothetical protein